MNDLLLAYDTYNNIPKYLVILPNNKNYKYTVININNKKNYIKYQFFFKIIISFIFYITIFFNIIFTIISIYYYYINEF